MNLYISSNSPCDRQLPLVYLFRQPKKTLKRLTEYQNVDVLFIMSKDTSRLFALSCCSYCLVFLLLAVALFITRSRFILKMLSCSLLYFQVKFYKYVYKKAWLLTTICLIIWNLRLSFFTEFFARCNFFSCETHSINCMTYIMRCAHHSNFLYSIRLA